MAPLSFAGSNSRPSGFLHFRSRAAIFMVVTLAACTPPEAPPGVSLEALDPVMRQAVEASRDKVQASPASGEAWGALGQLLDALEFFPEARRCYAKAATLDVGSSKWPHLLGLLQLQDQPEAALTNLAQAVALAGSEVDAPRLRLAQALVERGQTSQAVPYLQSLLSGNPGHPAARLELARIRIGEGQLDDSVALLSACLTNPYTGRSALLLLSQVRARQGSNDLANALGRRAASLPRGFDWPDPFLREVQSLRVDRTRQVDRAAALMAQGRTADAGVLLSNLLERLPGDPEALLLSGRVLLQGRDCAGAEARFREHLAVSGDSLHGWMQLAIALLCQQRWQDAVEALNRVIEMKPDFAEAHANLGLASSRLGDSESSIRSYRDALRCSPGNANTHAVLGEELARLGRKEEALESARRALALDPNHRRAQALHEALSGRATSAP